MRLFAKLNLPNAQAIAALSLPKIPAYPASPAGGRTGRHQKSKPYKNQALYGQTLIIEEKNILKLNRPETDKNLLLNFSECPNPFCDCGDALITISESDENKSTGPKMVLELNVHKHQVRLMDDFKEDWDEFLIQYYSRKYISTEFESETQDALYEFFAEHMSNEDLLIIFGTIYPASEVLTIEKDGIEYDVTEHYC